MIRTFHLRTPGAPRRGPHLPLLQDAQQAELHRGAHLADLVEEDGAAVASRRGLAALPVPGEGPASVAEELRFEQGFGERTAVLRDEAGGPARAIVVEEPREELLPRAGLPEQQHRGVAVEHLAGKAHRAA